MPERPAFARVLGCGSLRPSLRSGRRLVETDVVATSPYRIKSPVPVCCGFDSLKLARRAVAREGNGKGPPAPSVLRRGSLRSLLCRERRLVGERGLAPPRLTD